MGPAPLGARLQPHPPQRCELPSCLTYMSDWVIIGLFIEQVSETLSEEQPREGRKLPQEEHSKLERWNPQHRPEGWLEAGQQHRARRLFLRVLLQAVRPHTQQQMERSSPQSSICLGFGDLHEAWRERLVRGLIGPLLHQAVRAQRSLLGNGWRPQHEHQRGGGREGRD